MFDGHWRSAVDRGTKPVGAALQRAGLSADVLTALGLVMSVATALAVGSGHLLLGVLFLALTGLSDLLDGPVAKAAGTASMRGAFFDSVADRVSDAFLFGGVAWYLSTTHHGHLALLPFAVLAATSVISYQRAKAESLGLCAKGGLMERAERVVLLGLGLLFSAVLVPVLWVLLALVTATAVGRFVRIWRLADGPGVVVASADAPGVATSGAEASVVGDPTLRSAAAAPAEPGTTEPVRARLSGARPARTLAARSLSGMAGANPEEPWGPLVRWRRGRVDSRWRSWRETRVRRDGTPHPRASTHRRVGEPLGRWRVRREGTPATRTSRAWRTRGEPRPRTRSRSGRRPGSQPF